jgi:MscS family membrane protein
MTSRAPGFLRLIACVILFAFVSAGGAGAAGPSTDHPLEPPDRSSPRATLTTFLESIDAAWELYEADDPAFMEPFAAARGCLDLSQIPPLVYNEASATTALLLKDVLDRIELPSFNDIPNAAQVEESALERWTVPHTEITLVLISEGDFQGEWLFSARTVARAEQFYAKVAHVPYRPGRLGGHIEELRSGSRAVLLLKLADVMPPWFKDEVGGMLVWQWFGLLLLAAILAAGVGAAAWISRRWHESRWLGHRAARFLLPLALTSVPFLSRVFMARLFQLPGEPALVMRLVFSVVGQLGLMWLVGLLLIRFGEVVVAIWFRDARPLKKQLVRVVFRIATIAVITAIGLRAAHSLGVPVSGLIAGLGVGGLAIALAAQSTLENFIGGIILYADQPVKVGDFCKFGGRRGFVEDVGLRSTRIRTLERTLVTVPNADFAKMELENLSGRDRTLLRETIRLRYETTREQLQQVMAELEAMLRAHPEISEERLRVRFNGFGQYHQEVELNAYAATGEWPEFTRIREEILLEVLAIVERSPTRLALPTEVHYVHGQHEAQPGT